MNRQVLMPKGMDVIGAYGQIFRFDMFNPLDPSEESSKQVTRGQETNEKGRDKGFLIR